MGFQIGRKIRLQRARSAHKIYHFQLREPLFRRDFVSIKKYGNKYKLTYYKTNVRQQGFELKKKSASLERPVLEEPFGCGEYIDYLDFEDWGLLKENTASEDEKKVRLEQSLCRTRAKVRELALCNPWVYFVTLTLDKEKYDRYSLPKFQKDLTQYVRNQRRLHGCDIKYLLIPEQHKDGAWHMHGLMYGIAPKLLRRFELTEKLPRRMKKMIKDGEILWDWPGYRKKFGFVSMAEVKDHDRVSSYITKYITKDIQAARDRLHVHLYYASLGLARAELVHKGNIKNADAIVWDFENDYVKILWSDSADFQKVQYLDY